MENYVPWLQVRDLPKTSSVYRVKGWKTRREHHLTKLQYAYFLLAEWSDKVVDIREQYPMLPIERAQAIAEEIGMEYPVDPDSQMPLVITTDFLLTVEDEGGRYEIARSLVDRKELEKTAVVQRLELTRRFWQAQGVPWDLVTDTRLPGTMIRNVQHVHAAFHLEGTERYTVSELASLIPDLGRYLRDAKGTIKDALEEMERALNLEPGTANYLLTHLVARKQVVVDMREPLDITKPASVIKHIVENEEDMRVR
ncbi:TnsA endonuclease N-terminal domain-containing protein [Alicyclobacillus macrosporangiidus]|uniref:TnsA endonuclease N-terminal domain-containing protein n=1 Tax=Alicyclobacillus macrosporangiidus TaxID=392015 RepID=UPI0026EDFB23|nr:TnsA endonuclease N-terminal domain-containing protein [Alicyclobacillus macrosporangiidus]